MGRVNGKVVLMKTTASIMEWAKDLLGSGISFQLLSVHGNLGREAYLEDWDSKAKVTDGDSICKVTFDWDEEMGVPGALIVKNFYHTEFYLRTVTLEEVRCHGRVLFICNSWVYPTKKTESDRVFFTNQTYLPNQTPVVLRRYREEELAKLRGTGIIREPLEWDRVYEYDVYNDLGDADKGEKFIRPIFGGSERYPYPRRLRTGRPPTKSDPNTESISPLIKGLHTYLPRDEQLSYMKMSNAAILLFKELGQVLVAEVEGLVKADGSPNTFDKFKDVVDIYEGTIDQTTPQFLATLMKAIPLKLPMPQVIKEDNSAWSTDDEFAREFLAGLNPVVIRRVQEFPITSKLDPQKYGDHTSSITKEHIEKNLSGLTVEKAIEKGKIFVQDYHDAFMPYIRRINAESPVKAYAARVLLYLNEDGILKPVAIELSLPHPDGDIFGVISKVFTPTHEGVEGSIWQLAKAYASVNDTCYHQQISHWLHTHAVIEPFIIASNRHLSVLHPIYKLLHPHFKDTLGVNALNRRVLINAGGLAENSLFGAEFIVELTVDAYREWVFRDQALPVDLIKRGIAIEDSNYKYGLRLLIEDYPYAVDGLKIWFAIKTWVQDYCSFYYKDDDTVQQDTELQSWWQEVRNKGHGDKKDDPRWPSMRTLKELVDSCTILIWLASALHAAVNFGQYPYGGFPLNRPGRSIRLMPEPNTPEYKELEDNPEKAFLKTMTTTRIEALLGIALLELLSTHYPGEVYLGQRDTPEWTLDVEPLDAFERFGKSLHEIEKEINEMNCDGKFKNRFGPIKNPYTLLTPSSEGGLTGRGIPNSISI